MDRTEKALREKLAVWEKYARERYYLDLGQDNHWQRYVEAANQILAAAQTEKD